MLGRIAYNVTPAELLGRFVVELVPAGNAAFGEAWGIADAEPHVTFADAWRGNDAGSRSCGNEAAADCNIAELLVLEGPVGLFGKPVSGSIDL